MTTLGRTLRGFGYILIAIFAIALLADSYFLTQKKPCQPRTFVYDPAYSLEDMKCVDFRHSLRVKEYKSTRFRVYCDCPDKKVNDEVDDSPKNP